MSVFDDLLTIVAVEDADQFDIEDPEEAAKALLASLQGTPYTPPAQKRITTPIYQSPDTYEKSAPFPSEYKSAVNKRKGVIEAYLSVYDDPETGQPFVAPYLDVIERGSFSKSVANLETIRKRNNDPHLIPYLWQHQRLEPIGGVVSLKEDKLGIVYAAQLVQSVKRAQETLDLMEQKILGSSFGYDPVQFQYHGDIRHLKEIRLHECSAVVFPANPHARVLAVKSQFFVPPNYPTKTPVHVDWKSVNAGMRKTNDLFDQLINQGIHAYQQYKYDLERDRRY